MAPPSDDLFVPDPPVADSSNRIADTRFVQETIASTIATSVAILPSISSLALLANISTVAATASGFSVSSYLDNAVGSAQGDILYRNAATWVVLPPGTAGYLLQTQGAAANPQYVGGKVLLNTLSPNGVASTTDTTSLSSTYSQYEIALLALVPSTSGAVPLLQVHSGGYQTTAYLNSGAANGANSGVVAIAASTSSINLVNSNSAVRDTTWGAATTAPFLNGVIRLISPSAGSAHMAMVQVGYARALEGGATLLQNVGFWNSSGVIDGFAFSFNTGTISTGTIKVYGIS